MASTWGTNLYGVNSFGSDVNIVPVDGTPLASSIGQTQAFPELGWGGGEYGEQAFGALQDNGIVTETLLATTALTPPTIETFTDVEVTGLSSSINVGESESDVLNNGWGARVWGFSVWGSVGDVILTGQSLTTNIGDAVASIDVDVDVDGISAQTNIGESGSRIDVNLTAEGVALQTFVGNEDTEGEGLVIPTGISATANSGQATVDPTFLVGEGWGRDTFGNLGWGVNYSVIAAGPNGLSASIVTGNEDAFTDITVEVETAGELQTAITPVGTKADSDTEIAEGQLISTGIGDVTITGTANFTVTGIGSQTAIGDAVAGLLTEVPVTGVALTTNIGNSDQIGTATVDLTGIGLSANLGTITPVSKYEPGSVEATINAGQATAIGSATVIPTGVALTMSTISPNIIAWSEVDTGTEVTWTDVDLAA